MTGNKLIKYLEDWAPPGAGWERDNTGFQLGSGGEKIRNVFLCLELNEKALTEATKKNCNFIFTHHPLIYKPISRIDTENNQTAKIIQKTIKKDITVYSAHTNLDFAKDGVSFELAKVVGLKNVEFLVAESKNQYKLVVFVPGDKLELVSNAIFDAGGGVIGEYSKCSYRLSGEGTFEGSTTSKPAVGTKEKFETVNEKRLEVLVDSWNLNKVVDKMIKSHPYEEPAYDIYQLNNKNPNFGEGVIGDLEKSLTVNEFLKFIGEKLKISSFRFNKGKAGKVKRVAVCGGSGSNNYKDAIRAGADAFLTADIKYHTFQDAENKIMLVDAGHYETEIFVLNSVKRKIEDFLKTENEKIKVFKYSGSTNPVRIYNL
ncbi:Nif3-like dinuclear metal center hexameric protein [Bacteroidota bacterium]